MLVPKCIIQKFNTIKILTMVRKRKLTKMGNYDSIDNRFIGNYSSIENDFYNYKPTFLDRIKGIWSNFWWDYIQTGTIIIGGKTRGHHRFRWQRLFNIIMVIIFIIIFFVFKK